MRPLFIGQAPGPKSDPLNPLAGNTTSGRLLASLLGLEPELYEVLVDRVNLLQRFPGRTKTDDKFPMREARAAARALVPFIAGRQVVFVGRKVASAFGYEQAYGVWDKQALSYPSMQLPHRLLRFMTIPHPSGRCRYYKSAPDREAVASQLRTLVENSLDRGLRSVLT